MNSCEITPSETNNLGNNSADIGVIAREYLTNTDTPDEDHEKIKKALYQLVENQHFLLMGMPDRATHYMEMNTAQPPQGPMLRKDLNFIPPWIRQRINDCLKLIFNPKREDPYTGLHLIEQNLKNDLPGVDFTLVDHPKRKEILELIDKNYFPVICLSIGCENQIPDAEAFVEEIEERYKRWADMMKFLISSNGLPPTQWSNVALSGLKTFLKKIPGGDVMGRPAKVWAMKELRKRFGSELTDPSHFVFTELLLELSLTLSGIDTIQDRQPNLQTDRGSRSYSKCCRCRTAQHYIASGQTG